MNRSASQNLRYDIRLFILISAVGFLLSGCAGKGESVRTGYGFADSSEAALRLLIASGPTGTVTATARIQIDARGERYPLKALMLMKRPAQFRLESIPLLGPPDFFLTVDGDELRAFLAAKGTFYSGKATERNISRFFPLALPAAEMVSILMGQPPREGEDSVPRHGEREGELYRIDQYRAARKVRSLWIDPTGGFLTRIRSFTEGGEIAYTADFSGHTRVGEHFMPQRLAVSGEGMSMVLTYTEILAVDDDPAAFSLPVPEGISPVLLD